MIWNTTDSRQISTEGGPAQREPSALGSDADFAHRVSACFRSAH